MCKVSAISGSEKQERLARHDQRGGAAEDDRLARKVLQRKVCEGRVDEGDGAGHLWGMRHDLLTLRKGGAQREGSARKDAKTRRREDAKGGAFGPKLPPSRNVRRLMLQRSKRNTFASLRLCVR